VICTPGNDLWIYFLLILLVIVQFQFNCKTKETQYELKKNQKEYSLVMDELEKQNLVEIKGEK